MRSDTEERTGPVGEVARGLTLLQRKSGRALGARVLVGEDKSEEERTGDTTVTAGLLPKCDLEVMVFRVMRKVMEVRNAGCSQRLVVRRSLVEPMYYSPINMKQPTSTGAMPPA